MQRVNTVEVRVTIGRQASSELFGVEERFRIITDDDAKLIKVLAEIHHALLDIRKNHATQPAKAERRLGMSEVREEDLRPPFDPTGE